MSHWGCLWILLKTNADSRTMGIDWEEDIMINLRPCLSSASV